MPTAVKAYVKGLGMSVPSGVMTNDDFAKFLDTNDEWITQRTGIKRRHIVGPGESTASLSTQAARMALADAGLEASQLDLIIVATVSQEMLFPATACFVQAELGVTGIPAFDMSAACSGFVYALTMGAKFIECGMYRRVLVIGAETLSRFSDYTDRGSCILFGDGAGAAVLEATDNLSRGLQYSCLFADGAGWDFIHVPAGGSRQVATAETVEQRLHYIKMKGREVYKFAVDKMQWLLEDCMRACGFGVADVDLVVPHQVNSRIIESATAKLSFPPEKVYVNIDRYGNTSAASIPLALCEAKSEGKIQEGSTVVMVAFGAGLTWAGAVVKM